MARKLAGILLALILSAAATITAVMLLNDKDDKGGTEAGTTPTGDTTTSGSTTPGGSTGTGGNTNTDGSTSSDGSTSPGGSSSNGGTGTSGSTAAHNCEYVYKTTVEAKCLEQGYKLYECECGKTEKRNYIPNLGHDYAWTETATATCTEAGEKTGKCSRCGVTDTEVVGKLGHAYGDYNPASSATCTADATQEAKCARCGDRDTQIVPNTKTEHNVKEYRPNYDATCTKDGTKSGFCNTCQKTVTVKDEVRPAGCSYNIYYNYVEATCLVEGQNALKCHRCGNIKDPWKTGYAPHKINDSGVCTVCGKTVQKGRVRVYGIIETYYSDIEAENGIKGDFGNIYLEVELTSTPTDRGEIAYKMYIYKPYTDDGRPDGKLYEIGLGEFDFLGCTFFNITLWSVTDQKAFTLTGGTDPWLYSEEDCVGMTIWFSTDTSDTKNYRFRIADENYNPLPDSQQGIHIYF